jgi:uncharacterized protein YoxC
VANLLAELEPVRRAILESEDARREAARVLDALSEALLSIENAASECSTHVAALSQSSKAQAGVVQPAESAMEAVLSPLREAVEEVEQAFDIYPLQMGLATAADLARSIGEAIELSAAEISDELQAFRDALDGQIEGIETQASDVTESAEALLGSIPEWVAERTGEVTEALDQVSQNLEDCSEELQALVEEASEAFNANYLEEGVAAIHEAGGEMVATVDRLRDLGEKSIGDTRYRVRGITDAMSAIVDLIEPAKPVLDMASAVA